MVHIVRRRLSSEERLSKRKVITAIIITSLCWLLLDLCLIFSTPSLWPSSRKNRDSKLPFDQNDRGSQEARLLAHFKTSNIKPLGYDRSKFSLNRGTGESLKRITLTKYITKTFSPVKQEGTLPKVDNATHAHMQIKDKNLRTLPYVQTGPGEEGHAVYTRKQDEAKVKEGYRMASFNQFVSDQISAERSIPDSRPKSCKSKLYNYSQLPRTSIIMCFTEESWSTLIRSIHSIINRTPLELLEELILVDDASQRNYLHKRLDDYATRLPKVKLLRLKLRHGLIRARLEGIKIARAPIVTFLDSHIECNVGWLEPLLDRIQQDSHTVVTPVIDVIDSRTFQYKGPELANRGTFTWELIFKWRPIPPHELKKRKDASSPIRTPTIAGGLFSINKEFFSHLGFYDPGLDIWGSENLELSFKTWMCGGKLEMLPCSRVGHVFRQTQPYKFPDGNMETFMRNNQRVAQVWMDDYKDIFYMMRPDLKGKKYGNISERLKLREHLGCHDFKWYLNNIIPELYVPSTQLRASGQLRNIGSSLCLDGADTENTYAFVKMYPCHGLGGNQAFRWTKDLTIEIRDKCLSAGLAGSLTLVECNPQTPVHFTHTQGGYLVSQKTQLCVTVSTVKTDKLRVHLVKCNSRNLYQKWVFGVYHSLA